MKIPQSKSQMAFVSAVKSVREDEIRKVEIAWATPDELELIRTIAAQLGRQIMNMSLPTVRMLRAKADDEIFAWFGCDVDHDPERPEAFSFFVDPRYRKIRAGRLIRFGVALFLKERGCQK